MGHVTREWGISSMITSTAHQRHYNACLFRERALLLQGIMQSVVVCCNVWSALQYSAVFCSVMYSGAVWCSVVQYGTVWWSVVQCVAVPALMGLKKKAMTPKKRTMHSSRYSDDARKCSSWCSVIYFILANRKIFVCLCFGLATSLHRGRRGGFQGNQIQFVCKFVACSSLSLHWWCKWFGLQYSVITTTQFALKYRKCSLAAADGGGEVRR